MQRRRNRFGRIARAAVGVVAVVAVSTFADFAFNVSPPALADYCGDASDRLCGFGLPTSEQQPYCYITEVPIQFTLTSESTPGQTSSAQVSGTYTYPGGGSGTWRMNIVGPIATTTQSPYHTGPSWGLNNAGNPYAIFYGDLGKTNLFLNPTNSPASAELVQFRPNADADNLNGNRNTFANHTNRWAFDRTYAQYRLEDPSNQTTRNSGIYADTVLLYQRTALDNRVSDYVVTGDTASLWVQEYGGSAYEGWSQSAIAKYTSCLTVTETGAYVDANNNGYPDTGDHVEFTYVLTNPGSAELSGINLTDVGVTMNTSNVTVAGGASVTVTGQYPLTAADIMNGTVTRNATATGVDLFGNSVSDIADSPVVTTDVDPEGDGEPDDPTTVTLPPPAIDLGVKKTDDVDPVREGDTITYTITVYNEGLGTITPDDTFIVYDAVPPGLIDPQYFAPDPVQWDGATGEITGAQLAPGESLDLTVTAIAATSGATVENTVTVEPPTADPDDSNNTAVETTTILPKADLKITKSAAPTPVVAGTPITWTITVANGGPNDATNVLLSDAIPTEVTSPTVTGCGYSGTSCSLGTVAAGTSRTITITAVVTDDTPAGTAIDNSATVTSDTEDPDQTNNTAAASTPVEVESDVVLIKSSAPNPYVPGEPITYTFTIHNSGPSNATGVVLKDTFPAGLTGISADDPNCVVSGPDLTCELGTVPVGDTITITATADTDPGLVDPIINEAFVDVASPDPNLDNNVSADNNGAKPVADLRVIKSDLADPVLAGDAITYTVSVTNQGPSVATGVELTDDLAPAGIGLALSGVPTITAGSGTCSTTDCVFPELGVGETAVVTYAIEVPEDVGGGTTVTNTATVGSTVADPDAANNVADETTTIQTQADLSITKVGADAPVAGQNFTYTLTVANAGPSTAGTTVVTDQLPQGATFVAAGSSATCSASANAVSCDVPSLAAGDETEIAIEVSVDPAFVGTIANTATVAAGSNAPDPDTTNNAATHTGVASAEADLGVSKSVNKTNASAGTSLEWIVVVTNNGPSTATAVSLDDVVPDGVAVTSVTSTVGVSSCTAVSSCTLGDLAPGDVATITITGAIDPGVADGTELVNIAGVASATTDPNGDNNDAQVTTLVSAVADVSLVKTADPNPYTPGSPVDFTISATNLGPSNATGATIIDELPSNFNYTGYSVAAGAGGCNLAGTTLTCTADPMAPGAVFSVVVSGETDAGTVAAMSNTAAMAPPSAYTDPESGNDVSTVNLGSTPNADLGISKTPVGSVTTPGATKQWTLTVTNSGPTDASGVVVTDTLPTGAIFVSATPTNGSGTCSHDGAASGGVITCDLGAIGANGVITIAVDTTLDPSVPDGAELTNTADVAGDIDDANPDNNTAAATVTATRIADVAITKVDDPDPVVAGQPLTWTIGVANSGPSDAGSVVVTDALPDGFTVDSISPAGCALTGNEVSCSLGSVGPDAPVEITIVATASSNYVADGLPNPVPNIVTVTSPDDDNPANDQAQTSTLIVERSDVSITKNAPATVIVGDTITWTIDVTNAGPSVAEDVTVNDTIPAGITVDPSDISGSGCTLAGNDVTCDLGDLAAGGSTQIVINGSVPANYLSSGNPTTVSNHASISSSSTDTDIGNNQASADTVITEQADLSITKSVDPVEVAAGQQITWTVEVVNNGPADARGVKVTDTLPTGVAILSAVTDNAGSCDSAGTCLLGTVAADSTVVITIVGVVESDHGPGPITNTASVSALSPDPVPDNDTAETTATVIVEADLTVEKTGPTSAVPGQPISYTVTIFNNGPSDATGVQMNDTLPAGLVGATATTDVGGCATATLCDIGVLPAGATATITIDATVDPDSTATELTNSVNALPEASIGEPNPDDNDSSTTATVTPIADVSVTKIGDVNPVIAGTNLTWTLTATNDGPSTARDVVIADTLPPGVQLVSAPECTGTTTLECSIADLAAGDSSSVTIEVLVDSSYYDDGHTNPLTNTATVATTTAELDTSNNTTVETTTVADVAGVAVGKSHEGFSVTAGETSTWLVTVVNTGPSSAQDVVVTDSLPAGTTFVSATTSNGATCAESGGTITCELGSVPLNGLVDIVIELDVAADYLASGRSDPIPNSASATSTTSDPNPADNIGTDTLDVDDAADLAVTKTAPAEVNAGDQIEWDVTVTNNGPSVARDVVIDDPAPAGVVIDATNPSGRCDDFVTCQVGDLAPGASATVTITATVNPTWLTEAFSQPLTNVARVASSSTADPVADNNAASAGTIVTEAAALTVTKADSPDPVVAGETITWVVSVTNDGPSIAREVTVDDPVPAGVTVTSATASTGDGCTFTVSCTLGFVAVGTTETVTIVGVVDPSITAETSAIDNVATVTSLTNPDEQLSAQSTTTVENHADLSVIKTDGGATAIAGEALNWSIAVANDGPSDAPNTIVTDTLPTGLDPATIDVAISPSTAGTCDTSALPEIVCDLGTLGAGATSTISVAGIVESTYLADGNPDPMSNTAAVSSDATDTNPDNNSSTELTPIEESADLTLTKSAPATIAAGEQITWTIDVGNLGPSAASGIVITDNIPAGIVVDSATPGCVIDGQNITCTLAQLAVDATHTVTVIGTVPSDYVATGQPSEVTNGAAATSAVADPDPTNNTSQAPTSVDATVDLSVTKAVSPTAVAAGEAAAWSVTVTNAGPSTATNVTVSDELPAGFTPSAISADNGGACDAAATCLLGSIAPQETVIITVEGTVDADFFTNSGESPIANTATVTAAEQDLDTSNDVATATLEVSASADLEIAKSGAAQLVPGTSTEYTITVTNLGPSDALATTVTDELPPDLTDVTLTPSQGSCTAGVCDIGTVAAGDNVSIAVVGTVDANSTATTITNSATVSSPTTDPNDTNDGASVTADVEASADVSISKTESVDPVIAGQPLTWTIEATNAGPSTARAVVIRDSLPAGVALVDAGGCSGSADLMCDAGDIGVGETATFEVTVMVDADYYPAGNSSPISNTATHTAATADPEPANDDHTEITTVAALAGVAVGKSADTANTSAGSEVVWTITVVNSGPSAAENVVVTDPIPPGMSVTGAAAERGQCDVAAEIVCSLDVLAVDETVAITITSTVDPGYVANGLSDPLANLATATSSTDDPEPADNQGGDQVNIIATDDVAINKTGPAGAIAGEAIEWTVDISNNGPSVAQNVVFTDAVPDGITDTSALLSPPDIGTCDASVSCTIPTLGPGETATVTISGTVSPTWVVDGRGPTVTNTASITSAADSDPSNNADSATTNIDDNATLAITKVASPDPVNAGDELTWTIEVSNVGPSAADEVVVTDAVPDGIAVVGVTSSAGSCTFAITCDLGTVGVGDSVAIVITGAVPASWFTDGGTASVTNSGSVTTQTNPGETLSADAVSAIATSVDVSVVKTDIADPVVAGGPIGWVLTAANTGPSDATAVVVSDTLPDGLDLSTLTVSPASANCDTSSSPTITCSLGILAADTSVAIRVAATVDSTYLIDGRENPIGNGVSIATSSPESNLDNNADIANTEVQPLADVSVTKSASPATVVAGRKVTYTMTVGNAGPSTATGVALADIVPDGIAVRSATTDIADAEPCPVAGQAVMCALGNLAVGDDVTVTVVGDVDAAYVADQKPSPVANTARVTATSPDEVSTNDSDSVDVSVIDQADLSITKTASAPDVASGTALDWTVTVKNAGPSVARAVTMSDVVPDGYSVQSVNASNGAACDSTGCVLGDLAVGDSVTIEVSGTTDPLFDGGQQTNIASVASATADIDDTNNTAAATANVVPTVDLAVTKTGPPEYTPGGTVAYQIVIDNLGPSTATDVTLTEEYPVGYAVGSITPSQGNCVAVSSCDIGIIEPGARVTIDIDGTADPAVLDDFSNRATVAASQPDPNTDNNSGEVTSIASAAADVSIVKDDVEDLVIAGERVTWTLTATNAGPSVAREVTIDDTMPPGTTLVSTSAPCDGGADLSCPVGDLAPGESSMIAVVAVVDPDYYPGGKPNPLVNQAEVRTSTTDPRLGNNASSDTTTIGANAGLSIAKDADISTVDAGESIEWTLTVHNAGPSTGQNVVVADKLPDGVTFVSAQASNGTSCSENSGALSCALGDLAVGGDVTITVVADVAADYVSGGLSQPILNTATVAGDTEDPFLGDNVGLDQVTVTETADLNVTKTGPTTALAGGTVEWQVNVVNNGPSVARQVTLSDPAPAGVTITNATSSGGVASCNTVAACDLGDIEPGGEVAVTLTGIVDSTWTVDGRGDTLTNTASVDASTPDPSTVDNTDVATTAIAESAALVAVKTAHTDVAVAGEPVTWTIEVTNNGPSAARQLIIDDPAPAGTAVTAVTPTGMCSFAAVCTLGTLDAGQTTTVEVETTIDPHWFSDARGDTLVNTASVNSVTNGAETVVAEGTVEIDDAADLSVVKTADTGLVSAGETVMWAIAVHNDGPSSALAATLTDTLPPGVSGVNASPPTGVTCDTTALPALTCDLGDMADGDTITIPVSAVVDASYFVDGHTTPLVNQAEVTSPTSDPSPENNTAEVGAQVANDSGVAIGKSTATGEVTAGKTVTWTLEVTNSGPGYATGVTVADPIPAGVSVAADGALPSAGTCTVTASIECDLGAIAPGATALVSISGVVGDRYLLDQGDMLSNTASVSTASADDPSDNRSTAAVAVVDEADLTIEKTVSVPGTPDGAGPAVAGGPIVWTVSVSNGGPSTAQMIEVTDEVPDGVTITSIDPGTATCDTGAAIRCTIDELAPSNPAEPVSVAITIAATIDADYVDLGGPGAIANTARVTSSASDPTPDASTATIPVSESADLSITKTADEATAVAGGPIAWTVTVTNAGPSTAREITVNDAMPLGVTFTDVSATADGGSCDLTVTCSLGSLAPGSSTDITIRGVVDSAAVSGATIVNSATVDSATPDPVDNIDPVVETLVTTAADLTITKRDAADPVVAGTSVYWSIEVRNAGPSDASNVIVTDQLPDGVTLSSIGGQGASSCDLAAGCTFDTIESGGTRIVTVVGSVAPDVVGGAGANPLINTASATSDDPDPNPEDNVAQEDTTVSGQAGLSISKSVDVETAVAGGPLTWVLTVTNAGPSAASDVVVADELPSGVTVDTISAPEGTECSDITDCRLGSLGVGGAATVTVAATVDPSAVIDGITELRNVATVTAATEDADTADNEATVTTPVAASADLSLVKAVAGDIGAGGTLTWTLTVANAGPSVADAVTVTDELPAGLSVVSATPDDDGATCDDAIVCDLGRMDPGSVIVITVVTSTPLDGNDAKFVNSARVTSPTPDPDNSNNGGTANATALGSQIGLAKRLVNEPVLGPSGTFTVEYELNVVNTGSAPLSGVQIDDDLTERLEGVSSYDVLDVTSDDLTVNSDFDGADNTYLLAGTDVLGPGTSGTVRLRIVVTPAANPTELKNSAVATASPASGVTVSDRSVDGAEVDPDGDGDPNNNNGPTVATLEWTATIGAAKELAADVIAEQDGSFTVVFDIDVRNFGDVELSNVQITDDLAAAFSGATSFSVVSLQSPDLTVNPAFDGVTDNKMLAGTDTLPVDAGGTVLLTASVQAVSRDQKFDNIAVATATGPADQRVEDQSSLGSFGCDGGLKCDGTDISPTEPADDGATTVILPASGAGLVEPLAVGAVLTLGGTALVIAARRRRRRAATR